MDVNLKSTQNYEPMIQKKMDSKKSKFGNYAELFVGKKGLLPLLKYEIITSLFSGWPGAFGIFLRSIFYKFLFKKIGKSVIFGRHITIRNPYKIKIGDRVLIDDNCMLDAKGTNNEGIILDDGVYLGRNSILSCKNGDIILNKNVNVGFNCEVYSLSRVEIGENTLVAAYTYIIGGGHSSEEKDVLFRDQKKHAIGIKIGSNVWLGAKSIIMDGVVIGDNSIIGAAAVVTRNIPVSSVAVGIPAKIIKSRN